MPRPKKTPANTGLMPWPEVGKRVGLSARQAQREGEKALRKLASALEAEGIDIEYLDAYTRDKEREEAKPMDFLAFLLATDTKK